MAMWISKIQKKRIVDNKAFKENELNWADRNNLPFKADFICRKIDINSL